MPDLASWLLEQIDVDERWAEVAGGRDEWNETALVRLLGSAGRKRLAECEAKRRIVDLALQAAAKVDGEWGCCHDATAIRLGYRPAEHPGDTDGRITGPCYGVETVLPFLYALALPYADRPGYDEGWAQ